MISVWHDAMYNMIMLLKSFILFPKDMTISILSDPIYIDKYKL